MKSFFIIFFIILFTFFFGYSALNRIGRQIIYDIESNQTKYPGSGTLTSEFRERLFIIPIGDGRPFFTETKNKDKYAQDLYKVYNIPNQDQILYTVGFFNRYIEIEGSTDQYIEITNSKSKKIERHRIISKENSEKYEGNTTNFANELVEFSFRSKSQNKIIDLENDPNIKKGDVVILLPMFNPPQLNGIDENGNLLCLLLINRKSYIKL